MLIAVQDLKACEADSFWLEKKSSVGGKACVSRC